MGDTFGKYELVKKIARGGMAEVFLARQQGEIGGFTKHVAIKRLFPHLTEEQETIDMFMDEGRIAASLSHPNIVQIFDLGVVDDFLYIAMEYVHGRDLRSVLEEGYTQDNFVPIELAASIGAQVAAGLHYAHTRIGDDGEPMNIVHRDVSPQNILISGDGSVKICDFGIAKAEHRLSHTKAGQVKGKFSYMAPEQIETGNVDPRSDVFALGIVLYEMTTMTRLFRAENQYEALEKILYAGIEPPTSLRAGYPPELERIIMKALERDAGSRFQSAEQMQEELDNWLVANQASTSPVPIARYMRALFGDLTKPIQDQVVAETTGPMQVSEEIVKAVDGKPDTDATAINVDNDELAAAEKLAAEEDAKRSAAVDKKDVTEMDEDDLDAALDFALGAPSEADVVLQTPDSPAPIPVADQEPEVDHAGEDATVISDRSADLAHADAAAPTPDPEPEAPQTPAAASAAPPIVPTVAKEPTVDDLVGERDPDPQPVSVPDVPVAKAPELGNARSEPPPADRSGPPPAGPPPAAISGTIPTAPPSSKSAERRAREVMGEDDEPAYTPSDASLDELEDASGLAQTKTGVIVGVLGVLGVIAILGIVAASWNTEGSNMENEVKKSTIDPELLKIEVAPKAERVAAAIETTPAEVQVVINGLPADVEAGRVSLVKGRKNEVVVYAKGFKPGRAVVDGEGSGAPLSFTLDPLPAAEEIPPEELADLNIVTEPRNADVYVDGELVGKSPTTISGLWTGAEHHVFIELDDRYPYGAFVGLVKGSENLLEAQLAKLDAKGKKDTVEVLFKAIPRGTIVQLEGETERLGATPFFKNFDRNSHIVANLEEKDSVPTRRHLSLEDVGTFELRPFLQKMLREKGTLTIFVEPMGPEIYVGANAYGQGPAGNLVLPEGTVKVVLDTPHGREEVAVEVIPNTHTRYTLEHNKDGVKVIKKK